MDCPDCGVLSKSSTEPSRISSSSSSSSDGHDDFGSEAQQADAVPPAGPTLTLEVSERNLKRRKLEESGT